MLVYFVSHGKPRAGFDFVDEIIKIHPVIQDLLNLPKDQKEKNLKNYVEEFYSKHLSDLKGSVKKFQGIWDEVEGRFFELSAQIFSCSWPEGEYKSYVSMLPIGPRFLEDKTFQTCWLWEKNLKGQVIHELLHFQFFNLASLSDFDKKIDENKLWEISEIFNDIIQTQPEFISIQGYAPKPGYPEHMDKIEKYKEIWQKGNSADNFLKEILKDL